MSIKGNKKMENFKINDIPEMEDEELHELIEKLKTQYKSSQSNFALTCYYISKICDYYENKKIFLKGKDGDYYNCNTLLGKFGFDKTAISRLYSCYKRFCSIPSFLSEDNIHLLEQFQPYSPSKLFELLPLEDDSIEKCFDKGIIKPEMTVKEIRKTVKSLIHGDEAPQTASAEIETPEDIDESEIPMVYDPTKEYDFDYFKSKTKNQLLNMIMSLQEAYMKLKQKKVK